MKLRIRDRIVSAVLGVMVMAAALGALLFSVGVLSIGQAETVLNHFAASCPVRIVWRKNTARCEIGLPARGCSLYCHDP